MPSRISAGPSIFAPMLQLCDGELQADGPQIRRIKPKNTKAKNWKIAKSMLGALGGGLSVAKAGER